MDSTIIASIIGAIAVVVASVLPQYLNGRSHISGSGRKGASSLQASSHKSKTLKTWAGQSNFSYSGSVKEGTIITIGDSKQVSEVTAEQYKKMLDNFAGQVVKVGATQSSSYENGTLDAWLKQNVTKRMIATYVASILKNESYAANTQGKIEFNA